MAKKEKLLLQKKLQVQLGNLSLNKKDTAKIKVSGVGFDENEITAEVVRALLCNGQLNCRFDVGAATEMAQTALPGIEAPKSKAFTFSTTGHVGKVNMQMNDFDFDIVFPFDPTKMDTYLGLRYRPARLSVTRTADAKALPGDDKEGGLLEDEGDEK